MPASSTISSATVSWSGTAIAYTPFADSGDYGRHYRQFILDHFNTLVCENEMKWYATEAERGHVDYAPADALLAFADQVGLGCGVTACSGSWRGMFQRWLGMSTAEADHFIVSGSTDAEIASLSGNGQGSHSPRRRLHQIHH